MSTISKLTNGVLGTSKQLYLAGLGVVATVADQGNKTFNTLVEKGEQSSKKEVTEEEKKPNIITDSVKRVTDKATDRFQDGVSNVLGRLGIPTQEDIRSFTASIDQLTERVNAMQKDNAA